MQMVNQTTGLGEQLAHTLTAALQAHTRVIWLVPGGSNIPISIEAMRLVPEELTDKLIIMQTDERFVPLDSPDCNWKQLADGGFDTKYAQTFPILIAGADRDTVANEYAAIIDREFSRADYIVGQFGVGPDGHIAGVKPHSRASTTDRLAAGYQGEDFERISMTFPAISRIDAALAFVYGESKAPVLDMLASDDLPPLADFPAGILATVTDSTIFNDHVNKENI